MKYKMNILPNIIKTVPAVINLLSTTKSTKDTKIQKKLCALRGLRGDRACLDNGRCGTISLPIPSH